LASFDRGRSLNAENSLKFGMTTVTIENGNGMKVKTIGRR